MNINDALWNALKEDEKAELLAQYAARPAPGSNGNGNGPAAPLPDCRLDDTGNAERFVALYGDIARYDHSRRKWLVWHGTHWQPDDNAAVSRMARDTARHLYTEAAEAANAGDGGRAAELSKWARASASDNRRASILNLARAELPIAITHNQLNAIPLALNCLNGTIDLADGTLRPHERGDMFTYALPVDYDPAAACPTWDRFIERITGGNQDMARYLAAAVGYTLSGSATEQCLFFLHGRGANGKSTFIETIAALMGDLGHRARAQILMADERGRVPNEIAALAGRRFVVASELTDGGRLNESMIKDLTGGDTISARFLYGEPFSFKPTFTLWLYGNHKPVIAGTDDGIWRRVRLIPFEVQIPESERDPALPGALRAELAGILAWAIRGWKDYQMNGLHPPAAVTAATTDYRAESDTIGAFFDDCCILQPATTVRAGALYEAYNDWGKTNNIRPLSGVRFARALKERGFEGGRDMRGNYWNGIGLLAGTSDTGGRQA